MRFRQNGRIIKPGKKNFMNTANLKTNRILRFLPFLVFFLLSVFYFFQFTNYIFFYQEKSSLFLVSFQYLLEHLNQPGGFLNYLGELQTTFYFYPLAGAVLVSLEISLIILLISKIGKILSDRVSFVIPFLIGSALLYLQFHYRYNSLNNLGVLIQLFSFYIIVKYFKGDFLWIPVVLFPLQYFLFGSFSLIFLLSFSLFLVLNEKQKAVSKIAVLYITSVLFFFFGKEYLFFQTTETLLMFPYSVQGIGLQSPLFLVTLISVSILPLFFLININRLNSISFKRVALIEFTPLVIIIVLVFLAVPKIDKKNSHYFHVEKLFYEQQFDEIIAFNSQFPSNNILTNFLNNIALSETGKLNDKLFEFQQNPDGKTLFLKWEIVREVLKRGGYFYYSIGMINEAQRWAYEYIVMSGNTPEALKMIIKTELINGNYKMASKYISILRHSIFYSKEARAFEKLLFNDNAVETYFELGRKKQLKTKRDFFVMSGDPPANLDLILAGDSTNHFALEYKIAWLLMQKNFQGVVNELPNLEKYGYNRIPKNIEEAIVAYKLLNVGKLPELKKLTISLQTEQRFNQFYLIFQQNSANKQQAQRALSRNFSDTYWYYVFFN